MLTQEEDEEIHALTRQGWSIAAIARHTGRDRKTVRAYRLDGGVGMLGRTAVESETVVGTPADDDLGVGFPIAFVTFHADEPVSYPSSVGRPRVGRSRTARQRISCTRVVDLLLDVRFDSADSPVALEVTSPLTHRSSRPLERPTW